MNWFSGNIAEAVNLSKARNATFVVFVEGQDESSAHMTALINDVKIKNHLESKHFVAIKIVSGSEAYMQFAQIYQLVPLPSLFFIGKTGVPVLVVTSTTSTVDELEKQIISTLQLPNNASESSNFIRGEVAGSSQQNIQPNVTPSEEVVCVGDVCKIVTTDEEKLNDSKEAERSTQTQPSTSLESSSSNITSEAKLEKAKELIEKKRNEKDNEEKELERQAEIRRRKDGQQVQNLKKWQEEQEMKQLKEDRKKEVQEEQEARRRILAQIEQDRLERVQRFGPIPVSPGDNKEQTPLSNIQQNIPKSEPFARIQFKKPDGETEMHGFNSNDEFIVISNYVQNTIGLRDFILATTFPRREFTAADNNTKIVDLGLAPSSVILILTKFKSAPSSSVSTASQGFIAFVYALFQNLMIPVNAVYNYIGNFFASRNNSATGAQKRSNEDRLSDYDEAKRRNLQFYDKASSSKKPSPGGSSDKSEPYKRVGNSNVHRLHDNHDSDEDNNTWNGNSTQQQ